MDTFDESRSDQLGRPVVLFPALTAAKGLPAFYTVASVPFPLPFFGCTPSEETVPFIDGPFLA
jgi:hypothetical protein